MRLLWNDKKPSISLIRDERLYFRGTTLIHFLTEMRLPDTGAKPISCHVNGRLPIALTELRFSAMHSGASSVALTDRFTPTNGSLDNPGNLLFPIIMQKIINFRGAKGCDC